MKKYNSLAHFLTVFFVLLLTSACNLRDDDHSETAAVEQSNLSEDVLAEEVGVAENAAFAKPNIYSVQQSGESIEIFWDPVSAAEFRVIVWPVNDLPQTYVTQEFEFSTPVLNSSGEHIIMVEAYDELGNSLFSDPSTLEVM